jgi:hypothetical protein
MSSDLPNKIFSLNSLSETLFHGKVSNTLTIKPRKIVPRTHKDGSYNLMTTAFSNKDGCLGTIHLYDKNNNFEKVGVAYIYVMPTKRYFTMEYWDIESNEYYANEYLKNALKEKTTNLTEIENSYYDLCQKFNVKPNFNQIYNDHLAQESYLNGLIAGARNNDYYTDYITMDILPVLNKTYETHAIPIHNVDEFKKDLQTALDKIDHTVDEILKTKKDNMSSFQYVISSDEFKHGNVLKLIKDKIAYLTNKISSMHMTKWGTSFESDDDWED